MTVIGDMIWYDPAWIAVYVAIVAIIIATATSFVIYRKQKERKEISFGVDVATSLLSVSEEVESKIVVKYNDNTVKNIRLVIIRIWNSGKQPIKAEDYDDKNPIKFDFGLSSEILDAQIIQKVPTNLKVSLDKNKDTFSIPPFLLNSRDSLRIKVLLSSTIDVVKVDTRISGKEQALVSRGYTDVFKLLESFADLLSSGLIPYYPRITVEPH